MAKIKFNDLPKKDRIFKIVNLSIMACFSLVTLILGLYRGFALGQTKKLIAGVAIAVFFLIPYLYELIFRSRISNVLFLGIEIYLFFAGLLGSMAGLYDLVAWYDILVHTVMGYLVAMLGIFFISRLTNYKKMSPIAIAFFCLFFSLGIELVWEICEYVVDLTIGQEMQGIKVGIDEYGNLVPLVSDTIIDLCCNFTGALIFCLHFTIGKYSKYSLGVNTTERELAKIMVESEIVDIKTRLQSADKVIIKNCKKIKRNNAKKCFLPNTFHWKIT